MAVLNICFWSDREFDSLSGGIPRISVELGCALRIKGHNIFYLSANKNSETVFLSNQFYLPCSENILSKKNKLFILDFLKKHKIDVVINQRGADKKYSKALDGLQEYVKIVSVVHTTPLHGLKYPLYTYGYKFNIKGTSRINNLLSKLISFFFLLKYREHYLDISKKSAKVILLSNKLKVNIIKLLGRSNYIEYSTKYEVIPNGIKSVHTPHDVNKERRVLFVGRMQGYAKRVDVALYIVKKIAELYPNWTFYFLGEGPDKNRYRKDAKGINNVIFTGKVDPSLFYRKSSILLMTSSFEGFPMVLLEGMQEGVVPVLFDTFPAASDIVIDKKNGFLIKNLDIESYICSLEKLMSSPTLLKQMSENAKEHIISNFSLEKIGNQWEKLLYKTLKLAK